MAATYQWIGNSQACYVIRCLIDRSAISRGKEPPMTVARASYLLVLMPWLAGCGDDPAASRSDPTVMPAPPPPAISALLPSANQLQQWQQQADLFDGGYRPTGSPAHEGYIQWLAQTLTAVGVSEVHLEPYSFNRWTPIKWSVELIGGPSPGSVAVSGYVPYSGETGPGGVLAGLAYLPLPASLAAPALDGAALAPAARQDLAAAVSAVGGVTGKIVVFDVPRVALPLGALTGPMLLVNDPAGTLGPATVLLRNDLAAMLYVPAVLDALAAAGALGAVGILDAPADGARGEYAPFLGTTTPNLPALYVDRDTGAHLKRVLAATGPFQLARLTLFATVADAVSENIVGVIPGASPKELLLSSHTDGPNSIEDNGPVAVLALAQYFLQAPPAQRARTLRVVLTGGHFVGSRGIYSYLAAHLGELSERALAVVELEHLGAREWSEVTPGVMAPTGEPEPQLVFTWPNRPLVEASLAFGRAFPRTIVAGPPLLGEGQNYRVVPLIQYLTMPAYLLLGHLPAITSQLTDYALMQQEVAAFAQLVLDVSSAPANELGVR
jgi:hypothetical protein